MPDQGYVNFFEILGLDETAKPGTVRKQYKRLMKELVMEIGRVEITEERRARYLLDMAKLNAAFFVLRGNETRDAYWNEREEVMALEQQWREAAQRDPGSADTLRRAFDVKCRDFLSKYLEEVMLTAGRDKDCVEASHWNAAHERHASRLLRQFRHSAYRQILERLPFSEVTPPDIDWDERAQTAAAILAETMATRKGR